MQLAEFLGHRIDLRFVSGLHCRGQPGPDVALSLGHPLLQHAALGNRCVHPILLFRSQAQLRRKATLGKRS